MSSSSKVLHFWEPLNQKRVRSDIGNSEYDGDGSYNRNRTKPLNRLSSSESIMSRLVSSGTGWFFQRVVLDFETAGFLVGYIPLVSLLFLRSDRPGKV
jgi:hypothetical protein